MFQLTKSFRLLRFLNHRPNFVVRGLLGAVGWLGALAFTWHLNLANEVWSGFWSGKTKRTMRRLAWYGSRSALRVEPLTDPVFDISEGLNARQLGAVQRFLVMQGQGGLRGQLDQLTLLAAEAKPPMGEAEWHSFITSFAAQVDATLAITDHLPDAEGPVTPPERAGDFAIKAAGTALRDFADVFPVAITPWFVVSGTFLGLVREDGFLPHDYDIDLGLNAEACDFDTVLATIKADARFNVVDVMHQERLERVQGHGISAHRVPVLIKVVHRDGVHIDIFVHHLDGDVRWHGSSVHRWENAAFELAPYRLAGVDVLGPAQADAYLRENYGDWRTPVTAFASSTGTPNLRIVHNVASVVLVLKRYVLARQQSAALAAPIADLLIEGGYLKRAGGALQFDETSFDR